MIAERVETARRTNTFEKRDAPARSPQTKPLIEERELYFQPEQPRRLSIHEPLVADAPQPMARRRARTVMGHARERPMLAAVLVASFFVSLLAMYVGEYASVTADGLDQTRLHNQLAAAEREGSMLSAEAGSLTIPTLVRERAEKIGMVPNSAQSSELIEQPATMQAPAPQLITRR